MYEPITSTRAQRALRAAQEASRVDAQNAAVEIHESVAQNLYCHRCVAFALVCEADITYCDWSPSAGTAVQLLLIAKNLQKVVDGQLIWDRRAEWTNPQAIELAETAVAESVQLVKTIQIPFLFLVHVHGQPAIECHFNCNSYQSPLQALADELAAEVAFLPNV